MRRFLCNYIKAQETIIANVILNQIRLPGGLNALGVSESLLAPRMAEGVNPLDTLVYPDLCYRYVVFCF